LALLNYGADVKTKDRRGVTPLLLAAKNGHEEVAKTLMKKGLEENAAGSLGLMAPLEAAMTRQWETLRVLDLISRNTQIASSVDRYQQEPEILYRAQWPE
jgi:ankyrin repeat protein